MLRFLADENIEAALVQAVQRDPRMDIVRAQDVGLSGADDPAVLEWAAEEDRLVITHDANTMPRHARDRVNAGLPMPGVIEVPKPFRVGKVAEELVLLALCSRQGEWDERVVYLQG